MTHKYRVALAYKQAQDLYETISGVDVGKIPSEYVHAFMEYYHSLIGFTETLGNIDRAVGNEP